MAAWYSLTKSLSPNLTVDIQIRLGTLAPMIAQSKCSPVTVTASSASIHGGRRPRVSISLEKPTGSAHSSRRIQPRAARREDRTMAASASGIESEQIVEAAPESLIRDGDEGADSMKSRFEGMIREAQNSICAAIEELDGKGKFHEDCWTRPGGGGGISRVLSNGNVFEKAGVNVSVVYGVMPPDAYRAAIGRQGKQAAANGEGVPVPFFASGISSVMHPHNPMVRDLINLLLKVPPSPENIAKNICNQAPTVHFNYRYFETQRPDGMSAEDAPRAWWFGGGTDLTPSYIFEEDAKHFHQTLKDTCDSHDESFYPRFKKWCDEYFLIKHRGERRGIGGIFFDDMNDRAPEELFAFAKACANAVVPAYVPIVAKRKDMTFTPEQKEWQQIRRGRYVEFNLVYDRGTTFGLKTGGRIESILMSLPQIARWEYDHKPQEGSWEDKCLSAFKTPEEWLDVKNWQPSE